MAKNHEIFVYSALEQSCYNMLSKASDLTLRGTPFDEETDQKMSLIVCNGDQTPAREFEKMAESKCRCQIIYDQWKKFCPFVKVRAGSVFWLVFKL